MANHGSLAEAQQLRLTKGAGGPLAVPVTAVYGVAASGKTSVVDALAQMRDAVLNSVSGWDPYAGPVRRPHLGFADRPTEFVAGFVAEGVPYTYGFRLDSADVIAEWLYTHPRSRKRIVFERNGDQVKIGPMFEAARYGVTALVPLLRPNALLLSLAGQLYAEALVPAYRWFAANLQVQQGDIGVEALAYELGSHISRSPDNAARLLMLLRTADLGIEDLLIAEHDPMYADYLRDMDAGIASLTARLDQGGADVVLVERELSTLRAARDTLYRRMVDRRGPGLSLVHEGIDIAFDLADESTATRALLRVLPAMLEALDTGGVLAVDDLGAGLPVEETDRLVQLFQNPETNARGAQLIYTTANRALIDRNNGRSQRTRTAVWQVRRTQGVSELVGL
ncbi:ATP/GTP-binding protein [Nocardia ignorata]|uniref:AAA family ATPase n=1 Tax=Nocardia ignorata TaxID=145285 RepID=UPI00362B7490